MLKKLARGIRVLLAGVVLLAVPLACDWFEEEPSSDDGQDEIDLVKLDRDLQVAFLENVEAQGERPYRVTEDGAPNSSYCGPDYPGHPIYPKGENVPVSISSSPGKEPWDDSVAVTDESGTREYQRWGDEEHLFCRPLGVRYTEAGFQGWECVAIYDQTFELQVRAGDKVALGEVCYKATYDVNPDAEVERQTAELEATQAAMAEATLAAEAEATLTVEAEATLTAETGQMSDTDRDATESNVPAFTMDDCSCSGVDAPLVSDRSGASIKPGTFVSEMGTSYENVERLHCRWIDAYRSERKTAEIWLDLELYKLAGAQDAQKLYAEWRDEISELPQKCQKYDDCTVAVQEIGDRRALYVSKSTYHQQPSAHDAHLARLLTAADGESYVVRVYVTHPERDLADSWVVDVSQKLEACAAEIADR